MLVELLTPFVLATAPATVTLPEGMYYDHKTQVNVFVGEDEGTARTRTRTANRTSTVDNWKRPYDSDDDIDEM